MTDRIFAFLVNATADGSNSKYPAGRAHSLLVFVRQEETEPNLALCESVAHSAGWKDLKIQGAMLATAESVRKMQKKEDPAVAEAFAHASRHGFRVLVFNA